MENKTDIFLTIARQLQEDLSEELSVKIHTVAVNQYHYILESEGLPFSIHLYAAEFIGPKESVQKSIHLDIDILEADYQKTKSRILTLSGKANRLYARQTVVARVDKQVTIDFLQEHHLQEVMPGKYRYGLFYEGELVSIAVFGGGRKNHERPWANRSFELIRFCHKRNYLIVGGLSKLLKAFYTDFKPGDIMTYCDLDWSQNSSLSQLDFEVKGKIPAIKFLIIGHKRILLHSEEEQDRLEKEYPESYIKYNLGSLKMVKYYD